MFGHDVIVYAMEDFDGVWRRMQPLAVRFASRDRGTRVLFVGRSIDVSHLVRKRRLREIFHRLNARRPRATAEQGVYVVSVIKFLPNTLTLTRRINRWLERLQLRQAMKQVGIERPVLWLNPYYARHLQGKLGEVLTVYDVGDDWTALTQKEWLRKQVIAEDDALTASADLVVVVSDHLRRLKEGRARALVHVPNGVDVSRYVPIARGEQSRHPITADWKGPVIGYTGSLHEDRVDVDLIVALARLRRDITFALVGPSFLAADQFARLAAEENIRLTGPIDFADLPSVMAAFDVCYVPHRICAFTESLSPMKLYEYLAAGIPAVATKAAGFRDMPEHFRLADGPASFSDLIDDALAEPREACDARVAAARAHDWSHRMKDLEAAVSDALRSRTTPSVAEVAHV